MNNPFIHSQQRMFYHDLIFHCLIQQAYVRPSPNSGTLGGLSAYTADVVNLFEVCSAHSKTILHEAEQRVVVEKGRMGCSPYLGSLLS
jgi:hypothetical protein|mmetsp:Transcript_15518/g.28183  ORF Transcript_15518/g.28183 Transcript_15518/m.28183 type:complete len:88 (+) Transcript_15518:657-920(+)